MNTLKPSAAYMRFPCGISGKKAQQCPPPDASLPEYTVIYSDRKTLSMELKNGALVLRAPKKCPQSTVSRFILSHKDWIISRASAPPRLIEQELAPEELQSLKARARAYILPRARSLALSLNIGTGRPLRRHRRPHPLRQLLPKQQHKFFLLSCPVSR